MSCCFSSRRSGHAAALGVFVFTSEFCLCLASDQCAARLALFNKVSEADFDMCISPAPQRIHHVEDSRRDPTQSPPIFPVLAPVTKALKGLVQVIIAIVASQ